MEKKDSKQISKKNISESGKLHPTTPELHQPVTPIAISEKKKHIPKKQSKYRGVSWSKFHNKWTVVIMIRGKAINLGRHMTDKAAALAYDEFARKLIKRFTNNLNFPDNDSLGEVMQEQVVAEEAAEDLGGEDFFGPTTVADYEDARGSGDGDNLDEEN